MTAEDALFQYSLCRVVLMVLRSISVSPLLDPVSVLALSSRFDGLESQNRTVLVEKFQYSLCRVVLMVGALVRPSCSRT